MILSFKKLPYSLVKFFLLKESPIKIYMVKPIIITKDNKDSIFQIKKIERKKLYGYRKRLAIDENNEECKRASLTEDGQILIKSGMTSQGWYIDGGKQIESNEIGAIDENNNELSLIGIKEV